MPCRIASANATHRGLPKPNIGTDIRPAVCAGYSNQRKDEFLAMLAHELRNPLAFGARSTRRGYQPAAHPIALDDNIDAADSIALLLGIVGFEARSVNGALAALDSVGSFKPDVVAARYRPACAGWL
jgi:hypothetical protein